MAPTISDPSVSKSDLGARHIELRQKMATFGIHAMVLVSDWDNVLAERAIRAVADIGYDVIEIPLFDPIRVDLKRTRELLERHSVTPTVSLGLTAETDISSDDVAVSRAGALRLHEVVDATATIGGTLVAGVIASAWQKYLAPPTERGYANAVSALREVARDARDKGVCLAIEAVNRFESNLVNTCWQALRLLDAIGEDNVKVHLDTFHMHIEEPDPATAIVSCGPRLGYFHINESHRGYLGTGGIGFQSLFRALVQANYQGVISFEAFSSATCNSSVAGKAAIWRKVYEDAEDVARRALSFMRSAQDSAEKTQSLITGG
jgi:D-psicose/D-tagatose/L-ribulose 3-epimerase